MGGAIVSNTGPLVALAVLNRLDLLGLLFDDVLVQEAVHGELLAGALAAMRRHGYYLHEKIVAAILREAGER